MLYILFWLILGAAIGAIAFLLQRDKWKLYPFYAAALFAIGAAAQWNGRTLGGSWFSRFRRHCCFLPSSANLSISPEECL